MCEGNGVEMWPRAGRQAEVDRTGGDGLRSCQERDAQVRGKRRMAVE